MSIYDELKADQILDGRYRVIREIGDDVGGMGKVFLVEHQRLRKQMVAKVIRRELLTAETTLARKRFQNEAESTAKFDHDHIIRVTDCGEFPGGLYYVMEFIPGAVSLNKRLKDVLDQGASGLHPSEAVAYFLQATDALGAVHDAGYIHRDLKLQNFLVHPETLALKLIDFGIARAPNSELTAEGAIVGTVAWFSPEEAAFDAGSGDGKDIDFRSDYFKLGVAIYRCLTGKKPFTAKNHEDYLETIISYEPPPPSMLRDELDPRWDDLIEGLLDKSPKHRLCDPLEISKRLKAMTQNATDIENADDWFHGGDEDQGSCAWVESSKSSSVSKPSEQPTSSENRWHAIGTRTKWSLGLAMGSLLLLLMGLLMGKNDPAPVIPPPSASLGSPELAPKPVSPVDLLRDREKARILAVREQEKIPEKSTHVLETKVFDRTTQSPQRQRQQHVLVTTPTTVLSAIPSIGESLSEPGSIVKFDVPEKKNTATAPTSLGLPTGTRLVARLEHGIHLTPGESVPCIAVVMLPDWASAHVAGKQIKIMGTARMNNDVHSGRADVSFQSVVFDTDKEIPLRAVAMTPDGSMGIPGDMQRHDGKLKSNAVEGVLDVVTGIASTAIGARSGQRFTDDARREVRRDRQEHVELTLSTSRAFEIQLTRAL